MTRDRSGQLLQIQVSDSETQQAWQEAREAVAKELGVESTELSRWEIARELAECYIGRDGLGRWQEGE